MTVYQILLDLGCSFSQQDCNTIGKIIARIYRQDTGYPYPAIEQKENVGGETRTYIVTNYPEELRERITEDIKRYIDNGYQWEW